MTYSVCENSFATRILIGALTVSFAAHADCSTEVAQDSTKSVVVAAGPGQTERTDKSKGDRRRRISDLRPINGFSAEDIAAARAIAAGVVEISNAAKNGVPQNSGYHGGGVIIPNDYCPGRYVLSVKHIANRSKIEVINGKEREFFVPDVVKGVRVDVRHGLDGSSARFLNRGTVVAAGGFNGATSTDWMLVRLDTAFPNSAVKVAYGDEKSLSGLRMMSIGFPADMSGGRENRQLVVDPLCTSNGDKKTVSNGLRTTCFGTYGNSGGPIAAYGKGDSGQYVWRVVGIVAKMDEDTVEIDKNSGTLKGLLEYVSIEQVADELDEDMDRDVKRNGCG